MVAISARRSEDAILRGIRISSRYHKPHEVAHMRGVVESMSYATACHIDSIWCDSKACALYFVTLKDGTSDDCVQNDMARDVRRLAATMVWKSLSAAGQSTSARGGQSTNWKRTDMTRNTEIGEVARHRPGDLSVVAPR